MLFTASSGEGSCGIGPTKVDVHVLLASSTTHGDWSRVKNVCNSLTASSGENTCGDWSGLR